MVEEKKDIPKPQERRSSAVDVSCKDLGDGLGPNRKKDSQLETQLETQMDKQLGNPTRNPGNELGDDLAEDHEGEDLVDAEPAGLRGEEELDEIYSQRGAIAEDEAPEEAPEAEVRERRRGGKFRDANEVLLDELEQRYVRANERLKAQLTGTVLIDLRGKKRFMFTPTSSRPVIKEAEASSKGECSITLSEIELLRVANGELNPQVAMLSDKIHVEGKLNLAVYFFNLVAPMY